MSKHKKTRQQKIIAQLRRKINLEKQGTESLLSVNQLTAQLSQPQKTKFSYLPTNLQKTAPAQTYAYLSHDLLKTALLTSSIAVAEILLFFLSKNHTLRLPF
ncbi:MAG: hypothetical protein Q8P80_02360 [Candidatus Levybacteria bacterium]|nr:hypothetical protein [Candidatus Levybacteria bacterium]